MFYVSFSNTANIIKGYSFYAVKTLFFAVVIFYLYGFSKEMTAK